MNRPKYLFASVLILSGLLVAYDGLARYSKAESAAGIVLPVLMVVGAWILIGGWIGWNIAQWIGEKTGRLYWPKQTVIPPPLYFLTEHYEKQGRISEALQEYQKILKYHPAELSAHIGQLRCLALMGEAPRKLWKRYRVAFELLQTEREKEILTGEYGKLANATVAISGGWAP